MKTIYLASGNAHKLHELQTALDQAGLSVKVSGPDAIGGMPEVEETEPTFEGNSLLKANGLKESGPADGWFLADDSGIEIDALDGRPGVISARYAGLECDDEKNNDKVLEEMRDVPEQSRTCRFRCVLALVGDGLAETFSGACEGMLLPSVGVRAVLGMTRSFYQTRVSRLSRRFLSMKKQRSVIVPGH